MANHLEQLVGEWLEHRGYFVRRNVKVGKRAKGGHAGELDIVAYHPETKHLLHIEPSLDSSPWKRREERYAKKFEAGRKYARKEVFPWLRSNHRIEQWAILCASGANHETLGGGEVIPVGRFYRLLVDYVRELGGPATAAVPEIYPLLRTIQSVIYYVEHPKCKA
jgi:hypothetical protein